MTRDPNKFESFWQKSAKYITNAYFNDVQSAAIWLFPWHQMIKECQIRATGESVHVYFKMLLLCLPGTTKMCVVVCR